MDSRGASICQRESSDGADWEGGFKSRANSVAQIIQQTEAMNGMS
jgi:hypothetical protein